MAAEKQDDATGCGKYITGKITFTKPLMVTSTTINGKDSWIIIDPESSDPIPEKVTKEEYEGRGYSGLMKFRMCESCQEKLN